MFEEFDRQIIGDLYLSRRGMDFLTQLVENFGARFGGSEEERRAARFIQDHFADVGAHNAWTEEFSCRGWRRKETRLVSTDPVSREYDCIALPFCPPGEVEAPLVYLGDGHPQKYAEKQDQIDGAIVMVNTATPRFYHRSMHRGEKLGRALEANAAGFIWMRGAPGGLPETGSARFGYACEVPAISVSYETGHEILRAAGEEGVRLRITSSNQVYDTTSLNVVGELTGTDRADEVIVVGGHYDGHDISQSAADNGAGITVAAEALRALVPHADKLRRTVRFVGFAQEEMGLLGSEEYAKKHGEKSTEFMLNLDGAGRGDRTTLVLQGWPESVSYFEQMVKDMYETDITVGDSFGLYSDMYPFASRGIPAASLSSSSPASDDAPRGYGHTYWDSLDKVNPRFLQMDAARVARIILRLAAADEIPMQHKPVEKVRERIEEMGLDTVLRYENRTVPGTE